MICFCSGFCERQFIYFNCFAIIYCIANALVNYKLYIYIYIHTYIHIYIHIPGTVYYDFVIKTNGIRRQQ